MNPSELPYNLIVTSRYVINIMNKKLLLAFLLSLLPTALFADPIPTVSLPANTNSLFGSNLSAEISFSNTSGTVSDIGYYPIIEIIVPDGLDCSPTCASAFSWTTPAGAPLEVTVPTPSGGFAVNPITGESIALASNEKLIIIKAPTGTLSVGQPAIVGTLAMTFNATATLGVAEPLRARGIFVYGDIPNGTVSACGGAGDTICQSTVTTNFTPTILTADKTHTASPSTATGPNYPRSFTVTADIATAKRVQNLVIADTIPDTIVINNPPDAACLGGSFTITPAPTSCSYTHDANGGGSFSATFAELTGIAGNDISITYNGYVQEFNDNDGVTAIISPLTGADTNSVNPITVNFDYDHDDNLLTAPITQSAVNDSVNIEQRSYTLGKSANVIADSAPSGNSPGDTIRYTSTVYVSDYFDFNNFQFSDDIQDGQTFVPGTFSVEFTEGGFNQTITDESNFLSYLNLLAKDINGITHFDFDLAGALTDPLVFNQVDATVDGDRVASGTPTRIVIRYNTTIDENYSGPLGLGDTGVIDSHDEIHNTIDSDALVNATLNSRALSSSTTVEIVPITQFDKINAFKNGVAPGPGSVSVAPGDDITYKLTLELPIGDVEDLVIKDYLPTPLFEAIDPSADNSNLLFSANQDAQGDTAPAAGHWRYTTSSDITPAVTVTQNSNDNSITFSFGDVIEDGGASSSKTLEILFTVTATNNPMGDGLKLVNVLFSDNGNSNGETIVNTVNSIIDFITDQPEITVIKTDSSVVSGAAAVAADGFTNADAGDVLKFSVSMQNTGNFNAYDVQLSDLIPTGLKVPGAGINLLVNNVSGCNTAGLTNTSTPTHVSFTGLEISPGGSCLATFDLEVDAGLDFDSVITNTALVYFASQPAGILFSPASDTATVTIGRPSVAKAFVSGSTNFASSVDPDVVPGENLSFDVTATIPEGKASDFKIVENDQGTSLLNFSTFSNISYPQGPIITCAHNGTLYSMTSAPDLCFSASTPAVTKSADTITVNFGTMYNYNSNSAVAETLTVRYEVRVDTASGITAGSKNNRGRVIYDANSVNDTTVSSTITYPLKRPTLTTVKTSATVAPIAIGETITYQVTVTNTGNSTAFNTTVTDTLEAGLGNATLVSATYNGSDVTGSTNISQLGQVATITFLNTSSNPDIINGHALVVVYTAQVTGTMVSDSTSGSGHPGGITSNTGCVNTRANSARVSEYYSDDNSGGAQYSSSTSSVSKTLDNDNDGIANSIEGCADSDGDTIPDYLDTDSDDNDIPDSVEYNGGSNSDGDGTIDYQDTDDDNDGISDFNETSGSSADTDGDGKADFRDQDSDNDGIPDAAEGDHTVDTDGDGIPNFRDLDADNDGIPDIIEAGGVDIDNNGMVDVTTDTDNDGLANTFDSDNGGVPLLVPDTDGDGIKDYLDLDSDDDGISDLLESDGVDSDNDGLVDSYNDTTTNGWHDLYDGNAGGTSLALNDTDNDNIRDAVETDSDNDGINDIVEAQSDNPNDLGYITSSNTDIDADGIQDEFDTDLSGQFFVPVDLDGDSIPDYRDSDTDNDGVPDSSEGDETADDDSDNIPNYRELDNDNDGIPDIIEAGGVDTDGDGQLDGTTDADGDGLLSIVDPDEMGTALPDYDTDNDGHPDRSDLDSDNDGISDLLESDGTDSNNDGLVDGFTDTDGDGWNDAQDQSLMGTNLANTDTDNDGIPDRRETDSDNDSIPDFAEAQAANPADLAYNPPSGDDTDNDGIDDSYDSDQSGAFQIPVDFDSDGAPDFRDLDTDSDGILDSVEDDHNTDTDSDGDPDYRDLDSDGDGIFDILEAGGGSEDTNDDGQADDLTDTDGDGLADVFDADNGGTLPVITNTDGNGPADFRDADSDDDGINDNLETAGDFDGDGTSNFQDFDSDNDNIPDSIEGNVDTDGDGHPDYLDLDSDNDGIPDSVELDTDSDGDGIYNARDLDSDNDGIADIREAGGSDTDNNGILDTLTDTDNDGLADLVDADNSGTALANPDSDNDGFFDFLDIDADDDGIVDNVEAQGESATYIPPTGSDTDNDGLDDAYDTDQSGTLLIPVNTDLSDLPDYLDLDTDNDGVPDRIEGHDADHDGIADNTASGNDTDNDGLDDSFDTVALLPGNWSNNIIGSNSPLQDTDIDTLRDWRDTDDDGDTIPTAVEDGNNNDDYTDDDYDIDGTPDYLEPNDEDDDDLDGIPDIEEINNGTDPCDADTDNDGLNDGEESVDGTDGYVTNPLDADTDDDALSDGQEDLLNTNPLDPDTDGDSLTDGIEAGATSLIVGGISDCSGISFEGSAPGTPLDQCPDSTTNPLLFDTDGDGMSDGAEDSNLDGCFTDGETNPTDGLDACIDNSTAELSYGVDGSSKNLSDRVAIAGTITKKIAKAQSCRGLSKARINANNEAANTAYLRIWQLAWSAIPSLEYECTPVPTLICSNYDLTPFTSEILATGDNIVELAKSNLSKCARKSKRGKRFLRSLENDYYAAFLNEINAVPDEMLVCNN